MSREEFFNALLDLAKDARDGGLDADDVVTELEAAVVALAPEAESEVGE